MSRFARAVAIRPGEGRLVVLVAGAFAAVEAGRGLGEVGVDTLVLSRAGADILPTLYVGLGLLGLVITLGYGAALTRSSSQRFFPALLVLLASVLATEWLIALTGVEAIFPLIWISVYAAGLLLLTAIWTVGGFTFDARQAKRLFPLLTSAAIVGSLAGSLSAIVVQRILGAEVLILAEALLFLVAAALLSGLGPRVRPRRAPGETTPGLLVSITAGASYVASSPLMRLVAVAYVLLAILMFSLTFPFMSAMGDAFPDEGELLTVLAVLSAAVTAVSFLVGTLLANRLYARFGLATVALALPLMYLAGFGLWMVRFTVSTAVIVRFTQQVTQRGISNAAFSAFYSVVPARRRGQVLAFMDGVPGQLGTMLSGILLILATSMATEQVYQIGLVTAAICLAVLYLARRAYAGSLVAARREGRAEQLLEGGPGLEAMGRDSRVIAELRAATESERPSERLLAADLLARLGVAEASADLRRLTSDEDADVRRVALAGLVELEESGAADVLTAALADPDAQVRATAVAALGRLRLVEGLVPDVLERLRDDDSPVVRCELAVATAALGQSAEARAIVGSLVASQKAADRAAGLDALARIEGDIDPELVSEHLDDTSSRVRAAAFRAGAAHALVDLDVEIAALDDAAREVRVTAAGVVRARSDAAPALLGRLNDGSDRSQEAALWALEGHSETVRDELLVWAEAKTARATSLRDLALDLAPADPDSTAAYLGQVIARRGVAIEARLLQALALLGAPEASGLIRRCLHAPDPEIRAQAIEALDALGDARLARGVVRLLERETAGGNRASADIISAATTLADDRDRWVRALALRTLSEQYSYGRRSVAERAAADPDPLVRSAVAAQEGAEAMPEQLQLVSDIDRMLALRHVPLFAALDPEDLQRVAAAATEHSWAGGDELMAQGDLGSDLVVIVEGSVRVVHHDGDGTEHLLRTYGEGAHIGELAVLRAAPRAATVIAEASGVRGLVIDGEAVQALLRERPDAAMAMLATLAERISQQT